MSKRITLDNLKTFLTQLKTHITDPIINDVSTLTTKVRNAENNIITANSNISSVQQALNNKADKVKNQVLYGSLSSHFRTWLIGSNKIEGFAIPFRKDDDNDPSMPQFGAGIGWGQADTNGMLCVDYVNPKAYISGGNGDNLSWHKQIAWKDDLTNLQKTLFVRNDGIINKNINNCFNSENGEFRANESGQYLVMCSGYELQNSSTYVACVVSGISGNQNKLYTTGNSGFTFITLEKEQTLSLYTCVAGNINQECISSMTYVNMLIAKIN